MSLALLYNNNNTDFFFSVFITSTIRYLQVRSIIHDQLLFPMILYYYFRHHGNRPPRRSLAQWQSRNQNIGRNPYFRVDARRKDNANPWFSGLLLKMHMRMKVLNGFCFLIGFFILLSSIGTGAFRFGESFLFHNITAGGLFTLPLIYMMIQTYFSYRFYPFVNTRRVCLFVWLIILLLT